jgi:hypothetical protein
MQYMKRVLENRLANNPAQFSAPNAKDLFDIIRGHNQFRGFEHYPKLGQSEADRLSKLLADINNGALPLWSRYISFYNTAVEVANAAAIPDPCPTGLYGWKTEDASAPGPRFSLYKSIGGNDFYTLDTKATAKPTK